MSHGDNALSARKARGLRNLLLESLKHLAAPAEDQIAYVLGQYHDELGLEFDDIWPAADEKLTSGQRKVLQALDAQLDEMSGMHNADLWTDDGLRRDERWIRVRELAADALSTLEPGGSGRSST
jgi:HEAT repeat protein